MPNLLAHYGAQTAATRALLSRSDLKWILLGCLLPDVPWILQRASRTLGTLLDPYAVRLYAVAQATLACTLLLAAGLSLLSSRPRRVFALLSLNAVLALLLDGLQTKWGSGVHFLAPLSWSAWSLDLFFPESAVAYVLTGLGPVVVFLAFWVRPGDDIGAELGGRGRVAGATALLCAYLVVPFFLMSGVEETNTRYLRTVGNRSERPGRYVEFDRERYLAREGKDAIRIFTGEMIYLRRDHFASTGTVSLRGRFVTPDTIRAVDLHRHRAAYRQGASYVGLLLLVGVWARWAYRSFG